MIYFVSVSFALGILFQNFFGFGYVFYVFLILVSLSLFLILRKDALARKVLILVIFVLIGALRLEISDLPPDQSLIKFLNQNVSFSAEIVEEPDQRDASIMYVLKIDESKSKILVISDRFPKFEYGDQISISGKLELPKNFKNKNETEFDYVSYLSKDKVHFIIYRPEIEKVGENGNYILKNLYNLKNIFIDKISMVVPEPNSSLIGGLLFGSKQSLGTDLVESFRKVGLVHIVVLSGYNITVIAVGILLLFSKIFNRNYGLLFSTFSIAIFGAMVGFGATVVRASIMSIIAILAKYLGRESDALRWLFIAGLVMLLWNPLSLTHDPSFQLSFMATLGLLLFSNGVSEKIIFVPKKFELREIVASTLAVQIFLLPMLIRMSGEISLVSFIVNPLVLPFVPIAMGLGGFTGFIGIISKTLSWPFGAFAYFVTEIVIRLAETASAIPFATISLTDLPLWIIFTFYGLCALYYFKPANLLSIISQFKFSKKSSM